MSIFSRLSDIGNKAWNTAKALDYERGKDIASLFPPGSEIHDRFPMSEEERMDRQASSALGLVGSTASVGKAGSKALAKIAKRVHPEDARQMIEFIDGIRLKRIMSPELERDAVRLAEHYGISTKTFNTIANKFEALVEPYTKKVFNLKGALKQ